MPGRIKKPVYLLNRIDAVLAPNSRRELTEDEIISAALQEIMQEGEDANHPIEAEQQPLLTQVEKMETAREYVDAFRAEFSELPAESQHAILQYVIHRQKTGGHFDRMNFEIALQGGGLEIACIVTLQIALWQFVKEFRPDAEVPSSVRVAARLQHFKFSAEEPDATLDPHLITEAMGMNPGLIHGNMRHVFQQFMAQLQQQSQAANPAQSGLQLFQSMMQAATNGHQNPQAFQHLLGQTMQQLAQGPLRNNVADLGTIARSAQQTSREQGLTPAEQRQAVLQAVMDHQANVASRIVPGGGPISRLIIGSMISPLIGNGGGGAGAPAPAPARAQSILCRPPGGNDPSQGGGAAPGQGN